MAARNKRLGSCDVLCYAFYAVNGCWVFLGMSMRRDQTPCSDLHELFEEVKSSMQVEKAFDVLKEKAEGEILEATKAQVAQRTEKLLSAVDVDKFLQGAPLLSTFYMPALAPRDSLPLLYLWTPGLTLQ